MLKFFLVLAEGIRLLWREGAFYNAHLWGTEWGLNSLMLLSCLAIKLSVIIKGKKIPMGSHISKAQRRKEELNFSNKT